MQRPGSQILQRLRDPQTHAARRYKPVLVVKRRKPSKTVAPKHGKLSDLQQLFRAVS